MKKIIKKSWASIMLDRERGWTLIKAEDSDKEIWIETKCPTCKKTITIVTPLSVPNPNDEIYDNNTEIFYTTICTFCKQHQYPNLTEIWKKRLIYRLLKKLGVKKYYKQ